MFISDILNKLQTVINDALNPTEQVCVVDLSPTGKPPPSNILPFLAVGQGYQSPVVFDNTVKYLTHVNLTGTIRVQTQPIEEYKDPYLDLIDLMEKAHDAVVGNNTLLNYALSLRTRYSINVSGVFLISNFSLTPRVATPDWFSSEGRLGSRDKGYILSSTIRFPHVHKFLAC